MIKHHCPCGAKYTFEQQHAGKRAKCKRCGAVFVVPEAEQSDVIAIADEPVGLMDEVAAAAKRGAPPPPRPRPPGMIPPPEPRLVEPPLDVPAGEGYVANLVQSFLFASSPHNLIIFVIMWMLLLASKTLLPWAGCLGLIGILIVFGWYCTFRFNTIIEAARGEPDLPKLTFTNGFVDDVVTPFIGWVGSWLVVLVPAAVFFVLSKAYRNGQWGMAAAGGLGTLLAEARDVAPAFLALLAAGLFSWPIVALCVCMGGFETLGRPDLIIRTIIQTLPAYLLTVIMVFGTVAAGWFIADALQGMGARPNFGDVIVKKVFLIGLGLYLEVIAMRSIGLYYHHFKTRFAWEWE